MARKTQAEVIADLERKLKEARAKESEKDKTRVAYLVAAIKDIDEKIVGIEDKHQAKVAELIVAKKARIEKLEDKRALYDIELADLATESAETSEPVFSKVELEEV